MRTTKLSINKNLELFLAQGSFLALHNYTRHKTIIGDSNIPYHNFQAILDNYFDPDERDLCLDIFFLGNLYCAACKAKVPIDSLLSNKKKLSQFFHRISPDILPKDYSFGASNIDFAVKSEQANPSIRTQDFSLKSLSNKKSFIAGTLAIGNTFVSFIDTSKNCYTLEASVDFFRILFNADEESRKYLMTSLAWILLIKQGFRSYPGKDFFQYPLPKEGANCKVDRTRTVGTYTLTSSLLKTLSSLL